LGQLVKALPLIYHFSDRKQFDLQLPDSFQRADSDGARKHLRIPIASPAFICGINLKSQISNRLTRIWTHCSRSRSRSALATGDQPVTERSRSAQDFGDSRI